MPAKIRTINFAGSGDRGLVLLDFDRFAQFVQQDERRLVTAIEIARELKGGMTFCAVRKNRDCQKIVANRTLAVLKDRAGRNRKLIDAGPALPDGPRRKGADIDATATRAIRLSAVVGPAQFAERVARFLIRHAGDGAQTERPGLGGKKEMLRHNQIRYVNIGCNEVIYRCQWGKYRI